MKVGKASIKIKWLLFMAKAPNQTLGPLALHFRLKKHIVQHQKASLIIYGCEYNRFLI